MNYLLEPTPLDTSRMRQVEKVSLFDLSLSTSYLEALKPLMNQSPECTNQECTDFKLSGPTSNSEKLYPSNDEKLIPSNVFLADMIWSDGPFSFQGKGDEDCHVNFRSQHLDLWDKRYQQLVDFTAKHQHCNVPLNYKENPMLSNWTKRQRHQYRLKIEGRHTTMTDERQQMLENLGFVWDSHAAAWNERWEQLRDFFLEHGHSRVPKNYPKNQPLVSLSTFVSSLTSIPLLIDLVFAFCLSRRYGSSARDDNSNCLLKGSDQTSPKRGSRG